MKISQHFTRENPRKVVSLKDDAPQWLRDAVESAHQGTLSNDWVYEECYGAACSIDDELFSDRYPEDAIHEHADSQVEIYNSKLYAWATEMQGTNVFGCAEDEANDLLGGREDTIKRLQTIQYCAIRTITQSMVDAWREACDEAEQEESEDA